MEINNFTYKVGKNDKENDKLLDEANQNDLWFHLEGYASPHGILFTNGKDVAKINLLECANIVKMGSKLKNMKKVNVIYTQRRNVKKTDKLGQVIVKKTKVLQI